VRSEELTETAGYGQNEQEMRGIEETSGKEGSKLRSEKPIFPRSGKQALVEEFLRCRQAEPGCKGVRDAEQGDSGSARRWRADIASQSLGLRETGMRPLRTGKDHLLAACSGRRGLRGLHLDALVAQELHAGASMLPAAPVPPEQGSGPDDEGVQ
jgi:hypothetical protein